ncbi:LPD38 domain-containing protein [Thermomonas sp.]|uniref:LPD38 domain-containing protein n=1 Tax=Thermomonas sp. TaxID=1971895 RepID=UPI0035B0C717
MPGLFDDVLAPEKPAHSTQPAGLFDDVLADVPDFRNVRIGFASSEELGGTTADVAADDKPKKGGPGFGSIFMEGIKRGAASTVASALHTGADFVDKTVGEVNPFRLLYRQGLLTGTPEAIQDVTDPLHTRRVADENLAIEGTINADRQLAAEAIGGRPTLAQVIDDPSGAAAQYGKHLVNTGAESVFPMALALATRNPQVASAVMGGTTGAQTYTDLLGEGVTRPEAARAAVLTGLIESAGESLALPAVMGQRGAGSLVRAAALEGAQEAPVQVGQQQVSDVALGRETPILEQMAQALDAALVGAGMGGAGHVASNPRAFLPGGKESPAAPPSANDELGGPTVRPLGSLDEAPLGELGGLAPLGSRSVPRIAPAQVGTEKVIASEDGKLVGTDLPPLGAATAPPSAAPLFADVLGDPSPAATRRTAAELAPLGQVPPEDTADLDRLLAQRRAELASSAAQDVLGGSAQPRPISAPADVVSKVETSRNDSDARWRKPEAAGFAEGNAEAAAATSAPVQLPQAQQEGEQDAIRTGLRDAVAKAVGRSSVGIAYLRGTAGLQSVAKPEYAQRLEAQRAARDSSIGTAGIYVPASESLDGKPRVVVFTDAVTDPKEAAFVAAHEVAGHHGLRAWLGDDLNSAMEMALQNPTVLGLSDAIARSRQMKGGRSLAAEEALAELAAATRTGDWARIENTYGVAVPAGVRSVVRAAIDNFLRRLKMLANKAFGSEAAGFSDGQVRQLLENAWRAARQPTARDPRVADATTTPDSTTPAGDNYAREGQSTAKPQPPLEQVAFHGTPHKVDRFSLQKVGTGEGAQAYGWGMYFAGRKEVAEHYRTGLSEREFISHARDAYDEYTSPDEAVESLRNIEGLSEPQRDLIDALQADDWLGFDYPHQAISEALRRPERWELSPETQAALRRIGGLYSVDLPEDSDLLDWDKPLSQQPEKVKQALASLGLNTSEDNPGGEFAGQSMSFAPRTGRDAYTELARRFDPTFRPGHSEAKGPRAASEALLAAGVPGLRYLDGASRKTGEGTANYVIWSEGEVSEPQSALESTKIVQAEASADARRNAAAVGLNVARGAAGWNYDTSRWEGRRGAMKRMRSDLQDKMLAWRDVQGQLEATGTIVDDAANVYRMETLMHGRVSEGLDRIESDQVEPLIAAMKAAGVQADTLETYLYALYAKDRNASVAARNPAMPDGGSGMTDAEADSILATADRAKLDPLVSRVRRMVKATRHRLLSHGLITQDLFDAMEREPNYVPLRGKSDSANEGDGLGGLRGRGVDSRGSLVKDALGRGEGNKAQNILAEILGDAQRSVILAEKARVGRSVMRLVLANPNPSLWEVEPVQTERALNAAGEVYDKIVNDWHDPSIVAVRHKGELYRVKFSQPELAKALNLIGTEKIGAFVRAAGAINRYFSAVLTKYNPAFVPVNATRDAVFGLTGLAVEHGEAAALDAALHYPQAARAAWRYARGKQGSGQWDASAKEFAQAGGRTGYVNMPSIEEMQSRFAGKFGRMSDSRAMAAAKAIGDLVGDLNDGIENALRLSAFVTLRKRGMPAERAAEYAKNFTVNFNRKGYVGSQLNAWFLFYNAAMQGSHRALRLMKNPKTYGYLGALAAMQSIATLAALGMEDEDGEPMWNKVPDHVKRRNLVIVTPDRGVITIPMPYGFNVFPYLAGRMTGAILDKEGAGTKPEDRAGAVAADVMSAAVEGMFPIPVGDGALGMLPTVFRIPANVQVNRNDFGRPIHRDSFGRSDVPLATIGRPDTMEAFKLGAEGLNRIGGGDDYTPPAIDALNVAPEDLEYLLKELTGGAGQFVVDVATLGGKLAEDRALNEQAKRDLGGMDVGPKVSTIKPSDVPISKRFFTKVDEQAAQLSLFYNRRAVIERARRRVLDTLDEKGDAEAVKLLASLPELKGARLARGNAATEARDAVQSAYENGGFEAAEMERTKHSVLSGVTLSEAGGKLRMGGFKKAQEAGKGKGAAGAKLEIAGKRAPDQPPGSVFEAYKRAEKAMDDFREETEAAYRQEPARFIPTDATRLRNARLRTAGHVRAAAQDAFTTAWTRDVVGE